MADRLKAPTTAGAAWGEPPLPWKANAFELNSTALIDELCNA